MNKLREVAIIADNTGKDGIVRVIDVYNSNRRYLVKFSLDTYKVKVSGNEKADENVNNYLMTHTEDLKKRQIDREKIFREFDVFEEWDRPKSKGHKHGTRLTLRLGKIVSES